MTFDEALHKLAMLSEFSGMHSNYRDDFVITMAEAQDIVLELKDTYETSNMSKRGVYEQA